MYCNKCGNEIKDGEKFCGKCGTPVNSKELNKSNSTTKATKEKYLKKIQNILRDKKKIKIIILIIVILIIGIVIHTYNSSSGVINTTSRNNIQSSNTNPTTSSEPKILDVIDNNKKEFKINGEQFAEELINANKQLTAEKDGMLIDYNVVPVNLNNYTSYGVYNGLTDKASFIIETDNGTGNIKSIDVAWFYQNNYGKDINTAALKNSYEILYRALENINQNDLKRVIENLNSSSSKTEKGVLTILKEDGNGGYVYFLVEQ